MAPLFATAGGLAGAGAAGYGLAQGVKAGATLAGETYRKIFPDDAAREQPKPTLPAPEKTPRFTPYVKPSEPEPEYRPRSDQIGRPVAEVLDEIIAEQRRSRSANRQYADLSSLPSAPDLYDVMRRGRPFQSPLAAGFGDDVWDNAMG